MDRGGEMIAPSASRPLVCQSYVNCYELSFYNVIIATHRNARETFNTSLGED